ncbi:hypothetical protein [Pseudomonas sp. 6D_7.1_Bac1]|uniref:hypothetical protein n=1 Tax=Pseudomonas sp. 6D_7.1_Bac1 TaxID=2971615 RepID=UPI0021C5A5D5|nr:hypothetical protein [Pseudomonas sp. 6D_7.1_Bac1]MCU1751492.1 hypothetical protein [Pseudomonas sp. 6D_7.1_Bac1]
MEELDNQEPGAAIVGNGLITYVAGLSREEKRDVRYSLRLAHWAADRKYDYATELDDWFLYFAATLKFLGWVPSGDAITEIHHPNFYGTVAQVYLTSLIAGGNAAQANVTRAAFDALSADKSASKVFYSTSSQAGDFQILPVERDSQRRLKMTVNNFRLRSRSMPEEFLFFKWTEQTTKLLQHYGRFLLDRSVFEQNRAFLERRIKEIAISEFELNLQ